jgi:hypothetical protein
MILCQLKAVSIILKGLHSQLNIKALVTSHMELKVDEHSPIKKKTERKHDFSSF